LGGGYPRRNGRVKRRIARPGALARAALGAGLRLEPAGMAVPAWLPHGRAGVAGPEPVGRRRRVAG